MVSVVVVYHSGFGHTAKVAKHVAQGASAVEGVSVKLMSVDALEWRALDEADAIVFGSPTYMGSMSAPFKAFMDSTSRQWLMQRWKNKLSAGFANSGGLAGDKMNVLFQLHVFAMQHGMVWVGLPQLPSGTSPEDINRMGTYMGLMTQSDNDSAEVTPPIGDLKTAEIFGDHIAKSALRWATGTKVL